MRLTLLHARETSRLTRLDHEDIAHERHAFRPFPEDDFFRVFISSRAYFASLEGTCAPLPLHDVTTSARDVIMRRCNGTLCKLGFRNVLILAYIFISFAFCLLSLPLRFSFG